MSQNDNSLFSQHEHALEKAFGVCPECGSELIIKNSKKGAFIGCASYPVCHYTRPLVEHEKVEDKILPGTSCPLCGHELAVKQGRYGMFIGCTNFPQCHHIEHDEVETNQLVQCPNCKSGELHKKHNRFGKVFYACSNYPSCKFVVNFEPKEGRCEYCGFNLLLVKKSGTEQKIVCADKKCAKKQEQ